MAIYPKPFIQWVGGKTRLLPTIANYLPTTFNNYIEPFLGGGAVYYYLHSLKLQGIYSLPIVYLSDINNEIINIYNIVRDKSYELIDKLKEYKECDSKDLYYTLRKINPSILDELTRASRFKYLCDHAFNGLYRVNNKGEFNVSIGEMPLLDDWINEKNLLLCSQFLQDTKLECCSFEKISDIAQPQDFIYCDPPYVPLSKNSNFTKYNSSGFNNEHHRKLRDVICELDNRGCYIMLSNSNCPIVLELYKGFNIYEVKIIRGMGAATRSNHITELLITNYKEFRKDINPQMSLFDL